VDALDLSGDCAHDLEVDAVIALAAKRFAAQLEQDAAIPRTLPVGRGYGVKPP